MFVGVKVATGIFSVPEVQNSKHDLKQKTKRKVQKKEKKQIASIQTKRT
jgi:hypothetical protein